MTLKKGRALWRLPLIFIKVTSWINSKCRIYTTFKLWHKGTATRLGAKLWQCSLVSLSFFSGRDNVSRDAHFFFFWLTSSYAEDSNKMTVSCMFCVLQRGSWARMVVQALTCS